MSMKEFERKVVYEKPPVENLQGANQFKAKLY
jgi:hypothetical protein